MLCMAHLFVLDDGIYCHTIGSALFNYFFGQYSVNIIVRQVMLNVLLFQDGRTALLVVVSKGILVIVKYLIENTSADVNAVDHVSKENKKIYNEIKRM